MDHSMANLMEFNADIIQTKTIHSDNSKHGKNSDFGRNEKHVHNKEQHEQTEYFKKLGEEISKYDDVILFGPTNAKAELLNLLEEDQHFKKIKIEVQQTGKMTKNQQHAFVIEHFSMY